LVLLWFYIITFFRFRLAHIVDILVVIKESQENTKNVRRHEAHGSLWLLRKGNTEEKNKHRNNVRSNYCNWSPSYRSVE